MNVYLFGSHSGNNLGDAAILTSILYNCRNLPAHFFVPTPRPKFCASLKSFGNFTPVNIHPLTLSWRFLGFESLKCLKSCSLALICDGILFGRQLFNPMFNFLSNIFCLLPFLDKWKVDLWCFGAGLGPFQSKASRFMAKALLSRCSRLLLRDDDSIALARALDYQGTIIRVGDLAYLNYVSPDDAGNSIAYELGVFDKAAFGVNITKYLGSWLKRSVDQGKFLANLVDLVRFIKRSMGFEPVFISTHPMDDDINHAAALEVNCSFISAKKFLSHDLMSFLKKLKFLIGMRFHSLVLSSAVGTPVLAIIYADKAKSLMNLYKTEDFALTIDAVVENYWEQPLKRFTEDLDRIKIVQSQVVEREKELARLGIEELAKAVSKEEVKVKHG
jgi:polysaccharide pyruvyl transferase WcaK-like protein